MGSHPEWAPAVTRKNDLFYNASKAAFPGASVQWYGRGDHQYWGWCSCWAPNSCFTLAEAGDSTVGTELYLVYNASLTAATFGRAAATAAAAAQAHVTPYFAFGAGWLQVAGARQWTWNLSYDPAVSWAQGALLAPPATPPWDAVAVVGVYPHVLDARLAPAHSPVVGDTTTGQLHFVAYAMGVAQLTEFPTQPVMNVTAALPQRCPLPPAAPRRQWSNTVPLTLAITTPPLALALLTAAAVVAVRRWRRNSAAREEAEAVAGVEAGGFKPLSEGLN